MSPKRLKEAKNLAVAAAVAAGEKLKPHWGNISHQIKDGSDKEVVTELDRQTELFLAEKLEGLDDSIGFRGEEFGVRRAGDPTWLVDPIDGTIHFIRGLPFCTTMISLIENGQVILGVIHDFVADNTYWAIRGQGAFCNDQPIKVSQASTKTNRIIMLESDLSDPMAQALQIDPRLNGYGRSRNNYVLRTADSGWEFAMVASGKIDGRLVFCGFGYDYDYAPGSLLVSEAGGVVTNLGSDAYDYTNLNLLAANPAVHRELTSGPNALFPVGGQYQPLSPKTANPG